MNCCLKLCDPVLDYANKSLTVQAEVDADDSDIAIVARLDQLGAVAGPQGLEEAGVAGNL